MNWKTILIAGVIILLFGATYAQTPDGETPANQGVCDEVRDSCLRGARALCPGGELAHRQLA